MMITIPDKKLRGEAKTDAMELFASQLMALSHTIGFKVSSRGWCYILEDYGLGKSEFDRAQALINVCRKNGMLPVGFTADDGARATKFVEEEEVFTDMDDQAEWIVESAMDMYIRTWSPVSLWENQDNYVEVAVEKIDLVTLFSPICKSYHVPLTNFRGWSDINSRAAMMNRFQKWTDEGKQCYLLYCGDHDPAGLNISQSLRKNLNDLAEADGVDWFPDEVEIVRFGLNYDFIMANNLSWIHNLETSARRPGQKPLRLDNPRHKDHYKPYVQSYLKKYGARKVEANALVTRPKEGRQLLLDTLSQYVNFEAVLTYEFERADQRAELEGCVMDLMKEKYEAAE